MDGIMEGKYELLAFSFFPWKAVTMRRLCMLQVSWDAESLRMPAP